MSQKKVMQSEPTPPPPPKKNIYIYINIGNRKKTTLSSWQACFVIALSSGDLMISRSTLTYRALYYGKIVTQASYIYIYIYHAKDRPANSLKKQNDSMCACQRLFFIVTSAKSVFFLSTSASGWHRSRKIPAAREKKTSGTQGTRITISFDGRGEPSAWTKEEETN